MTDAARWTRLKTLFHAASTLPAEAREAYVRGEAADDPSLRDELLAMLDADGEATRRLGAPLRLAGEAMAPGDAAELPAGTRFGPWATYRLLGAGGMGQVYLGCRADGAYEREVAIKLLDARAADPGQRALFEYECRLLAQMQHPAIAQIHDAGIDAGGRPYLVMEYIEGEPVTDWCDRHRLDLRARVELFLTVCEGVEHAHQRGVIHRDLKPSNVLAGMADGRTVPRIIDFGIAVEAGRRSSFEAGTPGYMSPEQAVRDAMPDARSDVYSLGALLYELICGGRPGIDASDSRTPPSRRLLAMQAAERERIAASRRSRIPWLLRELDDGLEAIAMKALEPRPEHRYESVSSLRRDLRRWSRHYPPLVVRHRRALAARKFFVRHRLPVMSATAAAMGLVVGFAATVWSLQEARMEAARARVSADFLASILGSVDPAVARELDKTLMLRILDNASRDAAQALSAYPDVRADIELTIAANLARLSEYERAIAHLEPLLAQEPGSPRLSDVQRLRAISALGDALGASGRTEEAFEILADGVGLARQAPPAHRWRGHAMRTRLARIHGIRGEARQALAQAAAAAQGLKDTLPEDDDKRIEGEYQHASTQMGFGDVDLAIAGLLDLAERCRRLLGGDHPITLQVRRDLVISRMQAEDFERVVLDGEPLLADYLKIHGPDSKEVAIARGLMGVGLHRSGRAREAVPYFHAARDWLDSQAHDAGFAGIVVRHYYASWLLWSGRAQASADEQRTALATASQTLGPQSHMVGEIQRGLAEAELALGRVDRAREHADRATAIMARIYRGMTSPFLDDARLTSARVSRAEGAIATGSAAGVKTRLEIGAAPE